MRSERQTQALAPSSSWMLPIVLAGLGALGWACQDGEGMDTGSGGTVGEGAVSRRDVLQSIADNVLVPSTADFADRAASLQAATQAYADAVAADPAASEESHEGARQAWRDAMVQWQQLEVMQVGPAASSLAGIGGEDRRDAIYSWPTVDTCSVDRALVDAAYEGSDFFTTQLVWAYGLDALEYLLFVDDASHTCPSQVQLDGPWAELSAEDLQLRRAQYAAVLAVAVAEQATGLAMRWSGAGDDFAAALAEPAEGSSPYASDIEALDEVFRAMFYLDKQTKDGKLGLPLGLIEGCAAVPCSDLMEAPWSADGAAAVAANLRGLQLLVQGGPDPETALGFDDLLEDIGESSIAGTLLGQIDTAIALADGFEGPLQTAAVSDPDRVLALHTAVKDVTDTLKGPFVMALMLTVPAEGAGDND